MTYDASNPAVTPLFRRLQHPRHLPHAPPRRGLSFGRSERWPGVLQAALGPDWHVIEDGLPGRTIGRDDPVEGTDRNALRTLPASLQAHRPLDVVVFLLGTNDLKARFGASAEQIAEAPTP